MERLTIISWSLLDRSARLVIDETVAQMSLWRKDEISADEGEVELSPVNTLLIVARTNGQVD